MTDFLAMNRAVFESALGLNEQSVLLGLIDHLPNCSPSATRLEQWSKLSRSAVFRALAVLEELGVVKTTKVKGRSNTYTIDVAKLPTSVSQTPVPVSTRHQSRNDTSVPQTLHQCLPDTTLVSPRHGGSVSQTPEGTKEGTNKGTKEGISVLTPATLGAQRPRREVCDDIIKNPHLALTHEPHRWPEVVRPLEALAEADGKAKPRIGHYASDKAVRLLVEHLASGWEPAELERIYRAIPASSWWLKLVGSGSRPGASWLSPEVLRRHGEGDDPKTQLRASQTLARRHVEATRQAEAAKLVAEVAYTQSLVDPEDDWGQPQQIASNTVRRLQ